MQKEVIGATLAGDFDLEVTLRETTTICIERPVGTGAAVEIIDKEPNPFLATVGLRVEPAPVDAGVEFRRASDVLGTMPLAFFNAVEDTVKETLHQGLYGWQGPPIELVSLLLVDDEHQAAMIIPYYGETNPGFVDLAKRTVDEILADINA